MHLICCCKAPTIRSVELPLYWCWRKCRKCYHTRVYAETLKVAATLLPDVMFIG